ncbi:MAG: RNA polymerase sigma factor [Saprospiraceae bacterium]
MGKEDFLLAYKDKFYRFALRMTNDEFDAEDIMQELAIKIWQMGDDFDKIENKEAWCMSVTRNLAIDKIRDRKRKSTDSIETAIYTESSDETSPQKQLENNDLLANLKKLIDSMPENHKTVIQLREIEEMSYKEIADVMDTDIQNVKVTLFRARKVLQQLLIESKLKLN